jgi:aminopeptidase N
VHLIRQLFDDDEKFRMALREMNKRFYHSTTTSAAVEQFWSEQLKRDLSPLFDQFLRSTKIPTLEIQKNGNKIKYRWSDCNSNFNIPIRVFVDGQTKWLEPVTEWKEFTLKEKISTIEPDKNFFVGFAVLQ